MAAQNKNNIPFEIRDLDKKENDLLLKYFKGERHGFVRAGPKGYLFKKKYQHLAAEYYNMEIRPDDTFIVTYPRSGTTWTQELTWLVANNIDIETAKTVPLIERFPYLDMNLLMNPIVHEEYLEKFKGEPNKVKVLEHLNMRPAELVDVMPSPRFIKSHLPLSLLPPHLLDTCKVVFVARDPRDVAVSYYHLQRLLTIDYFKGDFKTYWNLFVNDLITFCPFFEFIKEAWSQRNHPNMLFLFYEELSKDLPKAIERVSNFLNKKLTREQVEKLCDHLNIENFKKNPSVNLDPVKQLGMFNEGEELFIRKGKAGGWRSYFDEEMTAQAERWISDNLRDTDLRFLSL